MNYERMVRQYGTRSNHRDRMQKLCRSCRDQTLPAITQMAFGSGGVDADGMLLSQPELRRHLRRNCLRRISAASYTDDKETTCRYTVRLGKAELANQNISEQGLFDSDGDLIAYKTFLPKEQG